MMNIANHRSAVIEQMRQERRARLTGRGVDAARYRVEPVILDPRLEDLKDEPRFAALLRIDDPGERDAALEEIQSLMVRCGYHQYTSRARHKMKNCRAVRARRAAQQPARGRGRPTGAQNFAARQFGLGLAMIWWEHTGRLPSRYRPFPGSNRGSYVEFVDMIVDAVPPPARKASSPALPGTHYLVRTSIKDFRAARSAPEEYRRRGLIEEGVWLNGPASA